MTSDSPYATPSEIDMQGLLNYFQSSMPIRGQKRQLVAAKLLLKIWIKSTERHYMSGQSLRLFELTKEFIDGSRY